MENIQDKLDNWFTYHQPTAEQAAKYEALREAGKVFAEKIAELCPDSADRSASLRQVREAVYSANASIACNGG